MINICSKVSNILTNQDNRGKRQRIIRRNKDCIVQINSPMITFKLLQKLIILIKKSQT